MVIGTADAPLNGQDLDWTRLDLSLLSSLHTMHNQSVLVNI